MSNTNSIPTAPSYGTSPPAYEDEPPVAKKKGYGCICVVNGAVVKMLGATLCIAGAVATWVAMAEALQKLNKEYKQTYFMIYFVHSSYALVYVGWALWAYFPYFCRGSVSCNKLGVGALNVFKPLGIWSGVLGVVSMTSGYAWYLSLTRTSIPANTSIYQCSSALVFVISVPLLKERVTVLKVLCVLLSICGVFLIAFFSTADACLPAHNITNVTYFTDIDDSPTPCEPVIENSTPVGYVLLVVSVLTYALYETFYKKFCTTKDDPASTFNSLRFLGYLGVHSLFWMWPPLIIVHYTGFETFKFPPNMEIFGLLLLNAFMDIIFNSCLVVGIALSSPLFVSVGTIVAVPTAVVVDLIVQHYLLPWQAFIGIALIVCGFVGFVISEFTELRRESKHKIQNEKLKKAVGSSDGSGSSLNEEDPLLNETDKIAQEPHKRNRRRKILLYLI